MRLSRRPKPLVLTQEQRDALAQRPNLGSGDNRTVFDVLACAYCGGIHAAKCPRVKRVEFQNDGATPSAVEFFSWGEWPEHTVLWPDAQIVIPDKED